MMKKVFLFSLVLIIAGALVTYFTGDSGQIHLRRYAEAAEFEREDGSTSQLPFSLRLREFRVEYYPDSEMPMDYVSEITLSPSGEQRTISMNHILKKNGYRFFQADYDQDLQGSILYVSHDPWGTGIVYAGYLLLLLSMLFINTKIFLSSKLRLSKWLKIALWVSGALLLTGVFFLIGRKLLSGHLMPVLRSPLLWIHVSSMIISYSIFALVTICSICGLSSRSLRIKLMKFNRAALCPAVFLMTFGIIIGSVWANISWGNYWSWDPKENWALITALIYSAGLYGERLKIFRRPVFFHIFCIIAFLSVLITYFGVNYIFGGMHSYA